MNGGFPQSPFIRERVHESPHVHECTVPTSSMTPIVNLALEQHQYIMVSLLLFRLSWHPVQPWAADESDCSAGAKGPSGPFLSGFLPGSQPPHLAPPYGLQAVTRVKPYICTMPLRLEEGWNTVHFNLADYTRRAYGTNYVETLRVQVLHSLEHVTAR